MNDNERTRALSSDVNIPYLGFGTYLISDDEAVAAVREAIRTGYRHIDTAEFIRTSAAWVKAFARRWKAARSRGGTSS